jgi:hypothetical protein
LPIAGGGVDCLPADVFAATCPASRADAGLPFRAGEDDFFVGAAAFLGFFCLFDFAMMLRPRSVEARAIAVKPLWLEPSPYQNYD